VWLPAVLTFLSQQTRSPEHIIGVDVGSADDSGQLLDDALGPDRVVHLPRDTALTGFGAAVQAGLTLATPAVDHPEVAEWLWLLHDDSAPDPDCLAALLEAADAHPRAVILGPKARGWHDRRLLLEVGFTVTGAGRRFTGLDPREHDQGQHDNRSEVHAVGTAGMLVRRDVFAALGGFDAALPLYRDDLDLCWRAWRADHEVRVVPAAVIHHREASYHGRREGSTRSGLGYRLDRRAALHVLLTQTPSWRLPFTALRLAAVSAIRSLLALLGKAPRRAADEVLSAGAVVAHPGRLRASRRHVRETSVRSSSAAVGEFRPGVATLTRQAFDTLSSSLVGSRGEREGIPVTAGAMESGPSDDAMDLYDDPTGTWLRRTLTRPGVLLSLILIVIAVAATRTLWWGEGALIGGALLPAPEGAGDLMEFYLAAWHDVGPGTTTAAPPWLALLSAFAFLLLGKAPVAVTVVLLLAVPMAGLSAWWSLRGVIASARVRAWVSIAYALLPAVLGAVATGRLGTAAAAVLLPPTIRAFVRVLGLQGAAMSAASGRTAWWAALLLAALSAVTPALWLIAVITVIAAVAVGIATGRSWPGLTTRRLILRSAIAVLVPIALLLPWSWHVALNPGLLFLEPGLPVASTLNLTGWDLLLVNPGGPGTGPFWIAAGVTVAGLLAILRGERRPAILGVLALGGVGFVLAVVMSHVRVADPSSSGTVLGWPGPATLVWGAALLAAAGMAGDGLRQRMTDEAFGWRQPVAGVAALAALSVPILAAIWWIPAGAGDPLRREPPGVLPPFVAAEALGPQAPRTLIVRPTPDGSVAYTLVNGAGPTLGDADVAPRAQVWQPLDALVAGLVSGRGGPEVAGLTEYAVRYVIAEVESSSSVVRNLDAVPGLRRIAGDADEVLWRLIGDTARARALPTDVATADEETAETRILPVSNIATADPLIDAPLPGPGEVRIAQDADSPWVATLSSGQTVTAATVDSGVEGVGLQRFLLPTSVTAGDRITVSIDSSERSRWMWVQGIIVLVVIVLALPGRRGDVDLDADSEVAEEVRADER
jgi:GT2 family glycosyltransferase